MKRLRTAIFATLFVTGFAAFAQSPLVTGNGFGFAVLNSGQVNKFYVHPYKFAKPDHSDPYGPGFETENLLQSLSWQGDSAAAGAEYENESQILTEKTAQAEHHYFMPFGLDQPALMILRKSSTPACLVAEWSHPVASTQAVAANGRSAQWIKFSDIQESALLIPLDSKTADLCAGNAWALLAVENPQDVQTMLATLIQWQAQLDGDGLFMRELSQVEHWRVPANLKFKSDAELKLWRQSEIILRMAQSREPNIPGRYNHGLIVASLPEGGWFMPWVRDMSYAALALIRMGHQLEGRWAVEAYFNARPIGRVENLVRGFPYQISVVRYFGDGSEETDFGGENAPNVELDNWGLALNVLSEYVEKFHDYAFLKTDSVRGSVYASARDFIVKPLLGNLDAIRGGVKIVTKDTSIWEANSGSEQHFAFSTAMAIRGLRGFAKLAQAAGDDASAKSVRAQVRLLRQGFRQAFVQDGYIHGTLEDNPVYNVDSAVLDTINFGAIADPLVIQRTLDAMELLKMPSGGYRRIRGDRQYDRQEFVYCDFNWARVLGRMGKWNKSTVLMKQVVQRSMDDHGFIPEMYVSEINDEYPGAIGAPTGSIPMVGYGAGMFVIYALERDSL